MSSRAAWITAGAIAAGAAALWLERPPPQAHHETPALPAPAASASAAAVGDDAATASDDARSHEFRVPSGRAPSLSCEAARTIVAQARTQLGYAPDKVDAQRLRRRRRRLARSLRALERGARRRRRRRVRQAVGRDRSRSSRAGAPGTATPRARWARRSSRGSAGCAPCSTTPASALRAPRRGDRRRGPGLRGRDRHAARAGARRVAGPPRRRHRAEPRPGRAAVRRTPRARATSRTDASDWAGVVLAAAVRAYVPAIDPHGAWAPLDEESSVYEVDLEAHPPQRLWDKAERTAIGLKIEGGADARRSPTGTSSCRSRASRPRASATSRPSSSGSRRPTRDPPRRRSSCAPARRRRSPTWLDGSADSAKRRATAADDDDDLPVERIEYGEGDAIVVAIHDVRDDLGDELTRALLRERERDGRPIAGVVLDVRGNGGGSTDGAIDALGLFIPGAPLFPMKRRDGSLETDRAPEPPGVDRWRGPVADAGRRRHRERRRDDRGRARRRTAAVRPSGHDHVRQGLRAGVPRRRRPRRRRPPDDAALRAARRHARAARRALTPDASAFPFGDRRRQRSRGRAAPRAADVARPRRPRSRGARARRRRHVDTAWPAARRQRRPVQGRRRLPRPAPARYEPDGAPRAEREGSR